MAISQNIKTPWVEENGLGGIDPARLAKSLEQLKTSMGLTGKATPEIIFDGSYLPAKEDRML